MIIQESSTVAQVKHDTLWTAEEAVGIKRYECICGTIFKCLCEDHVEMLNRQLDT